MRPGQDMAAARRMRFANARTRTVCRLLETAPPLLERHRYAIAQALAETQLWTGSDPGDVGSESPGAAGVPTKDTDSVQAGVPVCAGCSRPVVTAGGGRRSQWRHYDRTPICPDLLGDTDPVWLDLDVIP